jgi:hypothetical protein
MMNFLESGMGYGNVRQDTMRSLPARSQNAPTLTASTSAISPRGNAVVQTSAGVAGFGTDGILYGRMSLGFVASLVVLLALAYMWTRNVQGGG